MEVIFGRCDVWWQALSHGKVWLHRNPQAVCSDRSVCGKGHMTIMLRKNIPNWPVFPLDLHFIIVRHDVHCINYSITFPRMPVFIPESWTSGHRAQLSKLLGASFLHCRLFNISSAIKLNCRERPKHNTFKFTCAWLTKPAKYLQFVHLLISWFEVKEMRIFFSF